MKQDQVGAIIESGLSDWQIVQQDANGLGTITLQGRWVSEQPGVVEVRVVDGNTGVAVNRTLDWQPVEMLADNAWQITLRVPAGGLYRLETHLKTALPPEREWSTRGDMRHFWGVGDLWVIAGQSNSAGYGRGPVYDPPELGIHLFRNSETWALATHPMNDSTDTAHSVNREGANSAHSPYLHFGRLLKQQLGYPIGLVQTALGGSPLRQWNPTENAEAGLFQNMVHCVDCIGGAVKGVLWYQGESDREETLADTYEQRFAATVQAWREALRQPDLAVITVQLNRFFPQLPLEPLADASSARGWSKVREAQRQAARKLKQVAVVPTFDLPLSDLIHTSPQGNLLLGERMARAALGMVYGQPIAYLAPDLETARKAADGASIELLFANVTDRIDNIQRDANSFKVEDEAGEAPIVQVEYCLNHTLQLKLGRALVGNAVVHGGYGYNPPLVPVDMDRVLPMLGFYGVAVSS